MESVGPMVKSGTHGNRGHSKTFHCPEEGRGMKLSVLKRGGEQDWVTKKQKLFLSSPPPPPPPLSESA